MFECNICSISSLLSSTHRWNFFFRISFYNRVKFCFSLNDQKNNCICEKSIESWVFELYSTFWCKCKKTWTTVSNTWFVIICHHREKDILRFILDKINQSSNEEDELWSICIEWPAGWVSNRCLCSRTFVELHVLEHVVRQTNCSRTLCSKLDSRTFEETALREEVWILMK